MNEYRYTSAPRKTTAAQRESATKGQAALPLRVEIAGSFPTKSYAIVDSLDVTIAGTNQKDFAELIVKAVNNHSRLVEALKKIEETEMHLTLSCARLDKLDAIVINAVDSLRPAGDGERVTLYNVILAAVLKAVAVPPVPEQPKSKGAKGVSASPIDSEDLLREVTIKLQNDCIQIDPAKVYPVLRAAFAKLDSAALRASHEELLEALEKIEKMPWPNSESPYALIARAAIEKAKAIKQ